jgi:hypothetical protein
MKIKLLSYGSGLLLGQSLLWIIFHDVYRNIFALLFSILAIAVWEIVGRVLLNDKDPIA